MAQPELIPEEGRAWSRISTSKDKPPSAPRGQDASGLCGDAGPYRDGHHRSDRARLGPQGRVQGRGGFAAADPDGRRPPRRRAFGLAPTRRKTPSRPASLLGTLPAGDWHIETAPPTANRLLLGYGLGAYSFDRYRSERPPEPRLLIPQDADAADIKRQLAGVYLARDLINTPTNDMGPAERKRPSVRLPITTRRKFRLSSAMV